MELSSLNTFVDDRFDRLAEKRTDTAWLQHALKSPASRFVIVWQQRCAIEQMGLKFATSAELDGYETSAAILLGEVDGHPCFALDIGEQTTPMAPFEDWQFRDLRIIGTQLPSAEAALSAFALAMIFWHRRHRFCGRCGSSANAVEAGHALACGSHDCDHKSFPRSDPAIIVVPYHEDKILLGRQATWPSGRYSTIAGFVEPGESLEMAVRREVAEETGHVASKVDYLSSQPWPFPASLMLGFLTQISAHATHTPDQELEDVRWFSREDIVHLERNGPKLLPPPISIAYRIIEYWFDQESSTTLSDLIQ